MQLNHTIVHASDRHASARFLAEILGRPEPVAFGPFAVVTLDNGVSLDFMDARGAIQPQHYALPYWADPYHRRPHAINRNDGGRGISFEDPDGHDLEIITRPYGGG